MTIKQIQQTFQEDASALGDYQSLTKTELANGYCDAEEAEQAAIAEGDTKKASMYSALRSAYHSALMLRYWYKIWEWRKNSASLMLPETDFVDWLADSLHIAFVYKIWRYEFKAKTSLKENGKFLGWELDDDGNKIPNPYYWKKDPNAPDKIINRCCFSTRGREYQYYNKDKRKSNTQTYSLDSMIDEDGDYATQFTGCYTQDHHKCENPIYLLVNTFKERNELLESLIVDGMVNGDTFKEEKYTETVSNWDDDIKEYVDEEIEKTRFVFDARKLVKHLSHLTQEYVYQFCSSYDIETSVGDAMFNKLKKTSNQKLYDLIKKVQIEVKQDKDLLDIATSK